MEAAHPPFWIDEESRGTGVMLLPASPAAGLQMGAFSWGWEGRSIWEKGSKSLSDSATPLVSQLPGEASGCFLHGKLYFSSNCFFQFFPGLFTFRVIWNGSTSVGAWLVHGLHAAAMTVART